MLIKLRRASSAVIPPAIRSSGSLRNFHGVAVAAASINNTGAHMSGGVISAETESRSNPAAKGPDVAGAIESVMGFKPLKEIAVPDELRSFKVGEDPGTFTAYFKWEYRDEIIKVEPEPPYAYPHKGVVDEDETKYRMALKVTVTKRGSELQLMFDVTACPDKITINRLSMRKKRDFESGPEEEEDKYESQFKYAYEGPEKFSGVVDESLQKVLVNYLEVRGIKPGTAGFILDYITNEHKKEHNEEHKEWLKNLKRFFEQY